MISEDVSPFAKGFIGCENCGRLFVSSRYELEKAMCPVIVEWQIAHLVDDEEMKFR